jgi:hypothetical protein
VISVITREIYYLAAANSFTRNLRLTMAPPWITDEGRDCTLIDRLTTPTGVADLDFELSNQGDEDAWSEVNIPLNKESYIWKTHPMQYMHNMQGTLARKQGLNIFDQMDKERSKYMQKMIYFLEVFATSTLSP